MRSPRILLCTLLVACSPVPENVYLDAPIDPPADGAADGAPDDACATTTYYVDCDGDGIAALGAETQSACTEPAASSCGGAWVITAPTAATADCNDTRADVHPGATEVCDGVDSDCDGQTDEDGLTTFYRDSDGDGHGNPTATMSTCSAPANYVVAGDDCNDASNAIYPGRAETCDGLDNNCNSATDEGVQSTYYRDADGDAHGNAGMTTMACTAPSGYVASSDDCNDASVAIYPGHAEVCDGVDNNCNNATDEGVQTTYYLDLDADGYGTASVPIMACAPPAGYTTNTADCNDNSELVNPGAVEQCFNSVDDNCSGAQDEGARCNMDCNWSGARWLSHGFDNAGADDTGAWVTCAQNKIAGMRYVGTGGTLPGVIPTVSGTVTDIVDCNWTSDRWLSQGYDGLGNWTTFGADLTCASGRVTAMAWESNQLFPGQVPQTVSGQLACNWTGAIYLSHGIDGNCAGSNGISVTCANGHITGMVHASSGSCVSDGVRP